MRRCRGRGAKADGALCSDPDDAEDAERPMYSSSSESEYCNWADCSRAKPAELADRFAAALVALPPRRDK